MEITKTSGNTCKYFEVSAWTGDGFPDCIYQMTKQILESKIKEKDPDLYNSIVEKNIPFVGVEDPGERFRTPVQIKKKTSEYKPTEPQLVRPVSQIDKRKSHENAITLGQNQTTEKKPNRCKC